MLGFLLVVAVCGGAMSLRISARKDLLMSVQQDYSENIMNTYGRYPLTISYGKGCRLYDTDGKEYLDFAAGIATCCLGHAHPVLKKAIVDQMDRVNHVSNLYFIPEQAALAKWLVKNSCADKAFFCNSGAEANEAAIKLARKYAHTKLSIDYPVILTAIDSFHGRTLTTITATGQPKYQKDFGPLTPGFEYFEYNNIESLKRAVESVKSNKDKGHGLAAILIEPLQGEGGVRAGNVEFFKYVRQVCDDTGALMITDEVQTGMGRTGKLWGYQNLDIEPDAFTSAKALGGGVPIGAMLCKEAFNVFGPGDHASTYGGNPLACAAGVAVASVFDSENILENTRLRGEQLRGLALAIKKKFPGLIKEVRGLGLINGVELEADCGFTSADVSKYLLNAGVLVVPAGPKVVRFIPPLIISEADVAEAMKRFETALVTIQKENRAAASSQLNTDVSTPNTASSENIFDQIGTFFNNMFKN
jgi:acetylornithine/N-succinyldiaminopimelate aminotransferase